MFILFYWDRDGLHADKGVIRLQLLGKSDWCSWFLGFVIVDNLRFMFYIVDTCS